ncbi:endopeptidase La [Bradymonas sediminis]|uniref:Lon protease n=1 Tax=Bradymonas sediminis TaxID=1548548 RepID=A0A2Z4FNF7_9DELT|nr:endopeptidase La [Bradymonas sediminis]AWV90228.1 endopeptidase La [Bradymonas sediminis]TDP75804.1 ATP-dependent proteinase [Bradymonas sediminis]
MSSSQDSNNSADTAIRRLPLLPLRDIIVFPGRVVRLFVGRDKSIQALEEAMNADKDIALAAQIKSKTNNPTQDDIYAVGTVGRIVQLLRLPDGTVRVLVEGRRRMKIASFAKDEPYFEVDVREVQDVSASQTSSDAQLEIDRLIARVRAGFERYVQINKRVPPEMLSHVARVSDPGKLADLVVAHISLKLAEKQEILEAFDPLERLEKLDILMKAEQESQKADEDIRRRVKKQMERSQRDFYDKSKDGGSRKSWSNKKTQFDDEFEELETRIAEKELPEEARERLDKEMAKLKLMGPMSAEATVVRNYIDWVLALPWGEMTEDRIDVEEAEAILDSDHFGMEKPKERILEHLAVQALVDTPRGPILCLVGPPGVGKTSLGRSIARATGRNFVRLSLGGVRDEAEIRGHRRTYVGSMPGKLIQSLKRAGSSNPVFLLDEIDKMSTDFRGDPSAALLEVLDPEQNATFSDHYLDLDYDLSRVMFICTANDLSSIPAPLRDRMEIIELAGYTDREKVQIARRYLINKQQENNGISQVDVTLDDPAVIRVIEDYTREAGVRNLEQKLGSIFRKVARKVVSGGDESSYHIGPQHLEDYLGAPRFRKRELEQSDEVGLTNGMAWTQFGGVMLHAEATVMAGSGKVSITGKLGDVMQESARAAITYVRTRAENLGLRPDFHTRVDMHVHFPEAALPKDGPSAGVTMATSLVSALCGIPVRRDVAMTGEITLRGRVLAVGGLKEKLLAAHRAGIKKALIPGPNRNDLGEIPDSVREAMEIVPVESIDEVLGHALVLADPAEFLRRLRRPLADLQIRQIESGEFGLQPGEAEGFGDREDRQSVRHLDDSPIH